MTVDIMVRILVDKYGILIRAGDPNYSTKEIDEEILQTIKEGGQCKNVSYAVFSTMKLYEEVITK